MIHHISIPARDPAHVAEVLAELMRGYHGPFIGPIPNAYAAYAEDAEGSGIEVYPEYTVLAPGGRAPIIAASTPRESLPMHAFHALISVPVERGDIERIGAREGWHTRHFWRGPPGARLFELYEFWVENHTMLELVTTDMLPAYVAIANGGAQRALLGRRPGAV